MNLSLCRVLIRPYFLTSLSTYITIPQSFSSLSYTCLYPYPHRFLIELFLLFFSLTTHIQNMASQQPTHPYVAELGPPPWPLERMQSETDALYPGGYHERRYCITRNRCVLCQFSFLTNDKIVTSMLIPSSFSPLHLFTIR